MVFRVYVEKRGELAHEAMNLFENVRGFLGISALESVRILNRYDVEGIGEDLFESAVKTVFSEPQVDDASTDYDAEGGIVFAVEYLPGQFDQRADSAAQCIQILSRGERPTVRTAKIYILHGALTEDESQRSKNTSSTPWKQERRLLIFPQPLPCR